jgi:hypothetical protein
MLFLKENRLEELERQLREKLGRELTPREKFYLALSDACTASQPGQPREERQEAAW